MKNAKKDAILRLLHQNARLSAETIASMIDETPETVSQMIKEMEEERIILRYSAVVNWEKVKSERVTAVIDVKVTPQREVGFDAIAERIYRFSEVKSVSLMSGAYDLQIILDGDNIREIARFVSERLATIEYVISTTTHFLLKTYKSDGVIFEDSERERRLVVTP